MKYFLFIIFCFSLFFQVSCKEKEVDFDNMTVAEAKKYIKKNRKYETIDGCKVVARETEIGLFVPSDPVSEVFVNEYHYTLIFEPLARSVVLGELESVKCLLKSDYDVNIIDQEGLSRLSTALIGAVNSNYPKIVEALIKAGADVNEIDSNTGETFFLKLAEERDKYEKEEDFKEVLKILKANGAK